MSTTYCAYQLTLLYSTRLQPPTPTCKRLVYSTRLQPLHASDSTQSALYPDERDYISLPHQIKSKSTQKQTNKQTANDNKHAAAHLFMHAQAVADFIIEYVDTKSL